MYGIRHDTNSGVEGFFLLPFREKRSVFEKTRVKRKGGGRGDSLYKRASESCVKHSQDLFITGEGGYLETEIKLLSRYKYFVRELASKKNVSKFFRCFSPLCIGEIIPRTKRRVISSLVRLYRYPWTFRSRTLCVRRAMPKLQASDKRDFEKICGSLGHGLIHKFSIVLTNTLNLEQRTIISRPIRRREKT